MYSLYRARKLGNDIATVLRSDELLHTPKNSHDPRNL